MLTERFRTDGVFYSYFKLKEQEVRFFLLCISYAESWIRGQIRNIVWLSECIQQNAKERINECVVLSRLAG